MRWLLIGHQLQYCLCPMPCTGTLSLAVKEQDKGPRTTHIYVMCCACAHAHHIYMMCAAERRAWRVAPRATHIYVFGFFLSLPCLQVPCPALVLLLVLLVVYCPCSMGEDQRQPHVCTASLLYTHADAVASACSVCQCAPPDAVSAASGCFWAMQLADGHQRSLCTGCTAQ